MPPEPAVKRAVAFFDGQNLFHAAKGLFGAACPDFDPLSLARRVCVRLALSDAYDVALVFSQDQDLAEAALEVRDISMTTGRWIKVACAYPWSPASRKRGNYRVSRWPRE